MAEPPSLPPALATALASVTSVGAVTGAGVSRESGIRTYRGKGGLYDDPEEGARTVEALSGPTLVSDPDRTWRVVAELARQAGAAEPNPAHRALAAIEAKVDRFVLLTQNVDGLHRRAGSRNVIDIHGDVFRTRCMACDRTGDLGRGDLAALDRAPRCEGCGGVLRPDVVLFEELLPMDKVARVHREFHEHPPDVVIVAGTTALFPYIAAPVTTARERGKLTVEINPERTFLSDRVDHVLCGPAGSYLPLIERALPSRER